MEKYLKVGMEIVIAIFPDLLFAIKIQFIRISYYTYFYLSKKKYEFIKLIGFKEIIIRNIYYG